MCEQKKSDGPHSRIRWPVRTAPWPINQPKRDLQRLNELSTTSNGSTAGIRSLAALDRAVRVRSRSGIEQRSFFLWEGEIRAWLSINPAQRI
jgi:hypothetical protein